MQNILSTAKNFFEACEAGKGWQACQQYCHDNATFCCQTQALEPIKTLKDYTGFMVSILKIMPDACYQLLSFSEDKQRNTVAASAIFKGTHTGQNGPGNVAPTGKSTSSHYTYLMVFQGQKIKHMTKIWNHHFAFKQLGWI